MNDMTRELSTGRDASRWFSPLTWLGLLLRAYVALAFLLSGLVAAAVAAAVLLWEGCARLLRGRKQSRACIERQSGTERQ